MGGTQKKLTPKKKPLEDVLPPNPVSRPTENMKIVEWPLDVGFGCVFLSDRDNEGFEVSGKGNEKVVEVIEAVSESDDESFQPWNEESNAESDEVSLDDSDYEENWDWTIVLPPESLIDIGSAPRDPPFVLGSVDVTMGERIEEPATLSDFEDEDGDSSESTKFI
ncbi:hypothetical protein OROGR_022722 [Orobanche gracilis]